MSNSYFSKGKWWQLIMHSHKVFWSEIYKKIPNCIKFLWWLKMARINKLFDTTFINEHFNNIIRKSAIFEILENFLDRGNILLNLTFKRFFIRWSCKSTEITIQISIKRFSLDLFRLSFKLFVVGIVPFCIFIKIVPQSYISISDFNIRFLII